MRKINLVFIDDELSNPTRVKAIKNRYDDEFIETYCFDESARGLEFIIECTNPLILVLDLKMRDHEQQGIEILKEIRETNKNTPVIIRSGNNQITNDEFLELINNDISHFVKKGVKSADDEKEYIDNAKKYLMKNLSVALAEYINCRKDRNEVRIVTKSKAKGIPLNDILDEVNKSSELGIDFEKSIYKLSIELLTQKV